tara:strand:+ start:194 stop:556 length:363 start_codon:yes stop_codon:yes gene_type:complete
MRNIVFISTAAIIHFIFIVFIIFGGLFTSIIPPLIWAHIVCAVYGILMMTVGWRCPLSQYEAKLRLNRGQNINADEWEFLAHYFFRHIGLRGNEWFVTVIFVVALVGFNYQPYYLLISSI